MATENVYRRLQKHIDNMPVAYPATESGVELRLLKHLFTPEEAEMALHLSALPEPLEKIHSRAKKAGIGLDELKGGLNRLAHRGAIVKAEIKGKPHFSKAMLAIGMFEFQVDRLTKEFHSDMMQYMDGEFGKAFHTKGTSQMRTIPIREEVVLERLIGTYDGARELVMGSRGPFAVINCVCRQGMDLQEEPCRLSEIRETCLLMGEFAQMVIGAGNGRALSKEEMIGILERADEVGMVLQPQNTQNPSFICCCCGCCCGVLVSAKKLPRPAEYFDTNYYAEVDGEICTECGTCADRCEMDAISYVDDVAFVDLLRCIGCGLCVSTCPDGAIQLYQKTETKTPPKSQDALYQKIMMERFGPLGTAQIVAKKVLGMKI
ncbi:MAG: 4Fe-4S binding protein [Gemmatimonadetes bacterium]|nr:4Fe-4S binding protein [Gemmatimonadota bacterium]